jgi:hypothetical protein
MRTWIPTTPSRTRSFSSSSASGSCTPKQRKNVKTMIPRWSNRFLVKTLKYSAYVPVGGGSVNVTISEAQCAQTWAAIECCDMLRYYVIVQPSTYNNRFSAAICALLAMLLHQLYAIRTGDVMPEKHTVSGKSLNLEQKQRLILLCVGWRRRGLLLVSHKPTYRHFFLHSSAIYTC